MIGLTNNQYYTDIATALREKTETETKYAPPEMAEAIRNIHKGFSLVAKNTNELKGFLKAINNGSSLDNRVYCTSNNFQFGSDEININTSVEIVNLHAKQGVANYLRFHVGGTPETKAELKFSDCYFQSNFIMEMIELKENADIIFENCYFECNAPISGSGNNAMNPIIYFWNYGDDVNDGSTNTVKFIDSVLVKYFKETNDSPRLISAKQIGSDFTLILEGSTFENLQVTKPILDINHKCEINNCTFRNIETNCATENGIIYIRPQSQVKVDGTSFQKCTTSGNGILVVEENCMISQSNFTDNSAANGTLYIKDGITTVAEAEKPTNILNNTATENGGGIYIEANGSLTVESSTGGLSISGNSATNGGGIYSAGTVENNGVINIKGNSAALQGGGIYIDVDGSFTDTSNNATIINNSCPLYSGDQGAKEPMGRDIQLNHGTLTISPTLHGFMYEDMPTGEWRDELDPEYAEKGAGASESGWRHLNNNNIDYETETTFTGFKGYAFSEVDADFIEVDGYDVATDPEILEMLDRVFGGE